MPKILMQKNGSHWKPYEQESILESRNYKDNQVCEFSIKKAGAKKLRSLEMHRLYWGCVTCLTRHEVLGITSKKAMTELVKIKADQIDSIIIIDGKPNIVTKSESFDKMNHAESVEFMEAVIPVMAELLKVTPEELVENWKEI